MSERQEYVSSDQWSEKISDMCALDLVIRKEKTTHIKELKSGNNFFHPKPVLQAAVDNSALPDTIGLDDKVANMPRRNPTEGSNSRTIMTTISGLCNQPHAERRFMNKIYQNKTRSINLTTTADKFLFGTLDALSQRDEMLREEKSKSLDRSLCVQTHSHDTHFRFVENDGSQNHITTAQSGYYPTLSISMVSGSIETHTSDSSEMPNLDRTANATHPDGQVHEQSSSSKRSPTNRSSRPPLLPPCRVCGDRASGYHYGVNTCEACKGFFRRSICKTEPYVCNGSGDCKTIAGKRTACSHCRFKRCIEVGMSKNAIKTGRYTHELRSKNIMEVKRLQKQQSDDSTGSAVDASVELRSGEGLYTEYKRDLFKRTLLEETLNVLVEGQKMLSEFLDDYYNDQLIKERQMGVYNAYLLKKKKMEDKIKESTHVLSTMCHLNENISNGSVSDGVHYKAVNLKRTQQDPLDDVTNDVKRLKREGPGDTMISSRSENCHSNSSIQCAEVENIAVESDPKLLMKNDILKTEVESLKAEVMTKIIADMEQCVQGVLAFAKCLPGFDELPKDDQASLLKASRFDIWYIGHIRCFNVELRVGACEWQFHAEELAQVWGQDLVDLAFVMSRVAQDLDLTKQETSVLRAICLTFSDRCADLQAREKVDEINAFMLDVFRFVSCKKHNNFNKWFSRVISFLVILREFGVKFEKVSAELKLDWSVLKDNPLLLSVFLS